MTETALRSRTRRPARPSRAKGITAIAAGAVLLIGGGTTLAYWTASRSIEAPSIAAGDLNLTLGEGEWTLDGVVGDAVTVTSLANVRLVPGDVLALSQELDVTLVGDTIEAVLTADTAGMFVGDDADAFDVQFAVDGDPLGEGITFDSEDAGRHTVTASIRFDAGTPDRERVGVPIDLSKIRFTLTQASS